MKISEQDIKKVKAMGFLIDRINPTRFNGRVITVNGMLSSDDLNAISECAKKYGTGMVAFTSRMTVEIQGIEYENIPLAQEFLKNYGLEFGGTGDRVRPLTSCKGTTCIFGQISSSILTEKLHKLYFEGYKNVELPHKFKIAVGGCPNNCIKPDLNDVGIVGQTKPLIDSSLCKNCKKCICVDSCQMKACYKENGHLVHDYSKCNNCGKCVSKCYFKAVKPLEHGVKVLIGGKWGRVGRVGSDLGRIFTEEEAIIIVEKAILAFKLFAYKKERFGDMIDRIGFDKIRDFILSDEPLNRKDEIINMPCNKRPI
ncbi:MAG: 4Fe-4S binding protein [Anaeroplasma sp.]